MQSTTPLKRQGLEGSALDAVYQYKPESNLIISIHPFKPNHRESLTQISAQPKNQITCTPYFFSRPTMSPPTLTAPAFDIIVVGATGFT